MCATDDFATETALILAAVRKARERFFEGTGHGPLAPFGHIKTRESVPFFWGPFHAMLEDHAQHLANDVNAFGYHIGQLEAWSAILPDYSVVDQMLLLMEIVDPIATTAIGAPHALRSRFIYSISHLSHQANCITRPGWKESQLPSDNEINYKTMLATADGWGSFPALRSELDCLFDEAFNEATGDFRHKYHHRLPPRFQQGQTQTVTRRRDKASHNTTYGFGFVEPLDLASLTPVLRVKQAIARAAFEAYSELLREQLRAIYRDAAQPLC